MSPHRMPMPDKPKCQPYLRGPIPWGWLRTAIALPGSGLEVGLALWHYRALNRSVEFRVGIRDVADLLGLSSDTVRRGLRALVGAGLVGVSCQPGRKSTFTILGGDIEVATPDASNKPVTLVAAYQIPGMQTHPLCAGLFTGRADGLNDE